MANLPKTRKQFEAEKALAVDDLAVFAPYDECYATYSTADLSDERLPLFINALTQAKPVSFRGKVYFIKRIQMMEDQTIVVLKEFKK